MLKRIILVLSLWGISGSSWAQYSPPVMAYKSALCSLKVDGVVVKSIHQEFMTLLIDADLARFTQIQFGDTLHKTQYQLLIEHHPTKERSFLVLQNLLVGEEETSKEFPMTLVNQVHAVNANYRVTCRLFKERLNPAELVPH